MSGCNLSHKPRGHLTFVHTLVILVCAASVLAPLAAEGPLNLGNRRELFLDDYLIQSRTGSIGLKLHQPTKQEIAFKFDQPWEGNTSGYPTIMYDGTLYRMIYRGHRMTWASGKLLMANSPVVCYAESDDGFHWRRPQLNLFKWQGKDRDQLETPTANNIVWPGSDYSGTFVPFDDTNPACRSAERFKAIGGNHRVGLHLFTSPDAIHWTKRDTPLVTGGAFDSMNTLFWDPRIEKYTLYFRTVRDGLRSIDVTYSADLASWSEAIPLDYGDSPPQQMYTNGIQPYYRAPHLFVGFPTRYTARILTPRLAQLPPMALRKELGDAYARVASDLTDGLFMSSRDGVQFARWDEAFLRPAREDPAAAQNWMYGDNYQSYGLFETKAKNGQPEISFLVSRAYWQEYKSHLQRFSIRPDGFVSLHAKFAGGEIVTHPLTFHGAQLVLNYATSAAGSLQVELQDAEGDLLPIVVPPQVRDSGFNGNAVI